MDADDVDDLTLLANTPAQTECLLHFTFSRPPILKPHPKMQFSAI